MRLSAPFGLGNRIFPCAFASVVGILAVSQASAQNGSDAMVQTGNPTLKIDEARRYFVRFGYVAMKPNTKSGQVTDASGPVVTRQQLQDYGQELFDNGGNFNDILQAGIISGYNYNDAVPTSTGMRGDGRDALGIPGGIRVEAKSAGTPAVSLGYFFDEEQHWAVEAFVIAVPLNNDVYGRQSVNAKVTVGANTFDVVRPGALDNKKIMTTKVLPPLAMVNYYFGSKNAKWRPSIGVGAAYAIFFDTKAPQLVSDYSGGPTSVSLKNAFGVGGFGGIQYRIDDRWHLNATIGYLRLKTTGTITTEETRLSKASAALQDYGGYTSNAINAAAAGPVNRILFNLANWKNGQNGVTTTDGNYGKFVRKIETRLDPYIFWVSAGYSF